MYFIHQEKNKKNDLYLLFFATDFVFVLFVLLFVLLVLVFILFVSFSDKLNSTSFSHQLFHIQKYSLHFTYKSQPIFAIMLNLQNNSYQCDSCHVIGLGGGVKNPITDWYICADCCEQFCRQQYDTVYRVALSAYCLEWDKQNNNGIVSPLHCDYLEKYCDDIAVSCFSIVESSKVLHSNQQLVMEILEIPQINKIYAINVMRINDDIKCISTNTKQKLQKIKKQIPKDAAFMIENCSYPELKRICSNFLSDQPQHQACKKIIQLCVVFLINNKHILTITDQHPKYLKLKHFSIINDEQIAPRLTHDISIQPLSSSLINISMNTKYNTNNYQFSSVSSNLYHPVKLIKYKHNQTYDVNYKQVHSKNDSNSTNTIRWTNQTKQIELVFIEHSGLRIAINTPKKNNTLNQPSPKTNDNSQPNYKTNNTLNQPSPNNTLIEPSPNNTSFVELIDSMQQRHERQGNVVFCETVRPSPFPDGDKRNELCRYCWMELWSKKHKKNCWAIPEWIRQGHPKPLFKEYTQYEKQKEKPKEKSTTDELRCIFVQWDKSSIPSTQYKSCLESIESCVQFYCNYYQPLSDIMDAWYKINQLTDEKNNFQWSYETNFNVFPWESASDVPMWFIETITNDRKLPQDTITVKYYKSR